MVHTFQIHQLKKIIFVTFFLSVSLLIHVNKIHATEIKTPERIILNLTTDPATSQAVTWRADFQFKSTCAQISPASATPDLEKNAQSVDAQSIELKINETDSVMQHSVAFTGLTPNTVYAYRVSNGETWSEWNHFRTADNKQQPFQFLYFGDPQNDLKKLCSRIFREAYTKAAVAKFWLFTGDIVDQSDKDEEWGEFYYALGWIPRMTPFILVPGNHGYNSVSVGDEKVRKLNPFWRPQFTLPENGPEGLEETAYYVDYQGVRFVMLNGNEKLEQQANWLNDILANNPNKWTIAAIHQPFYSTGKNRDNVYLRELFVHLFDKYNVDLVLQGHDHCYGRTHKLRDGKVVADNKKGTVYVVSVSGSKVYDLNPKFENLMAKMGTGNQLFQVISLDNNLLKYECRTATGELYDGFELKK